MEGDRIFGKSFETSIFTYVDDLCYWDDSLLSCFMSWSRNTISHYLPVLTIVANGTVRA